MNVLLMLLGVLIVYIAVKLVYRYNWNKNLTVSLEFDKKHVVKDDIVNITEVVTNAKRLPLPCINLKFQAARELLLQVQILIQAYRIRLTVMMYFRFFLIRELQERFLSGAQEGAFTAFQVLRLYSLACL